MYKQAVFPLLCLLDPEDAHDLVLKTLRGVGNSYLGRAGLTKCFYFDDPRLAVDLWEIHFPNIVGLAAGMDKNAQAVRGFAALGFGHASVGTVTPRPQVGNNRPRLFRLVEDLGIINRMGFNSQGIYVAIANLEESEDTGMILGASLGANKSTVESGDPSDDYVEVLTALGHLVQFVEVNVSSPNTTNLRKLQGKEALDYLLSRVMRIRNKIFPTCPVLVKIAPDLTWQEIDTILEVGTSWGISGYVATNTTIARPGSLASFYKTELGGLSGEKLREHSTAIIRYIYQRTQGAVPIVGVGGISSAFHALEKLEAGAVLIQLYTGLIYQGPALPQQIKQGLATYLDQVGAKNVAELVGRKVEVQAL